MTKPFHLTLKDMKKLSLSLLISVLFTQYAQARHFSLTCSTPTTIIHLWTEHEYLISRIHHPYGVQFTPFFKGQVSLFQMPDILIKAQFHQALPKLQEVQWPLEKCQFRLPYIISCQDGKLTIPEDGQARPYFMETSLSTTEFANGSSYEGLNFRLGLTQEDNYHMITSDYSPQMHCRFSQAD